MGGFTLSPGLPVAHTADVLGMAGEGVGCRNHVPWHWHLLKSFSVNPSINYKCSQTVFKKLSSVYKSYPTPENSHKLVCVPWSIYVEGNPKYYQEP